MEKAVSIKLGVKVSKNIERLILPLLQKISNNTFYFYQNILLMI
ncbi:hypothetical protein DCAR_0730175 [Daucus carota subsp. sativus]|uniref:Uncharacterized protein n=1 Tax=Daucus carota subsp. sativus TaxID=79200 RepID=A0AAF1AU42_DAUCS|nr:hypothetical protein DCAR_0311604 [Daucus carota subsp. sativus]WOH10705.1 hypothetical protein DCAR_0730175 [Daucus carota subsp. sativus]